MAKNDGNLNNNKARSSKPYDASNSFVKKVASRVTGLIPQSTSWLSGWFSPSSDLSQSSAKERREQLSADDDDFQDACEQPPPSKRFKLADNQPYPVETFSRSTPNFAGDGRNRRVPNDFIDLSTVPGPSGLEPCGGAFAVSTPAMTAMVHQESKANGDDCSESGESTSGCSSLEPQMNRGLPSAQSSSQVRQHDSSSPRKRLIDDKLNYNYMQNSRSLFLDRSLSSCNNQSVGRRNKPSFCVNTFGSTLFGDKNSLNNCIVNSPFYAGRTTFGGASSSSYRRSIGSTSVSSSPANSDKLARHTIKVKPSHSSTTLDSSMSQTARRILATLEQFSTPVLDAKRIPVSPQEPGNESSGTRKRLRANDNEEPRLVLQHARTPVRAQSRTLHWAGGPPSISKLTVPATPDTLIMRRRERLQDSTTAARLMAISAPVTDTTCGLEAYRLRTENENIKAKNSLKMKAVSKIRQERESKAPELPAEVNLPKIPLPIASLPSFDISVPPPKAASVAAAPKCSAPLSFLKPVLQSPLKSNSTTLQISSAVAGHSLSDSTFSFSSPIGVTPSVKDRSLTPISNFSFSSPLPAGGKSSEGVTNCVRARPKIHNTEGVNDGSSFASGLKPASELRMGSVMDILGKSGNNSVKNSNERLSLLEKFKPAAGSWECATCMIRNKSELTRCASCISPREPLKSSAETAAAASSSLKSTVSSPGFGAQFKMSPGSWECTVCLVRNKDNVGTCASCLAAKAGSKAKEPMKPATSVTSCSGWGDKFKPASNTWECSACMVRNSSELAACQACTTPKPGSAPRNSSALQSSWGDKFKKPEGTWQCGDCLVDNKPTDVKCAACQAKKPGTESAPPSPSVATTQKFSFGIPPVTGTAFSFGVPPDKKEVEAPKSSVTSSTDFKLGVTPAPAVPAGGFIFGIPASVASLGSDSGAKPSPAATTASAPATAATSGAPAAQSAPAAPVPPAALAVPAVPPALAAPAVPPALAAPAVPPAPPAAAPPASTPVSAQSVVPGMAASVPSRESGQVSSPKAQAEKSIFMSRPPSFSASVFGLPSAPVHQPSSSSEEVSVVSPLGGKRKHADDTPSSTAIPFKFGALNQPDVVSQTKPVSTSSSNVSSTSGPVFSAASSAAGGLAVSSAVTSSAAQAPATNSLFAKLVSSPTSSSSGKLNAVFGANATSPKDESVTSTWKQPGAIAPLGSDPKVNADSSASSANSKPTFCFGGSVSSSGMTLGANAAGSSTQIFTFGGSSEKRSTPNKPVLPFETSGFNSIAAVSPAFGSTGLTFGSSVNSSQNFAPAVPAFGSSATPTFSPAFNMNSEEKKTNVPFTSSSDGKNPFSLGTSENEKKTAFGFQTSTTTQSSTFPTQTSGVYPFGGVQPAANGPTKPDIGFGNSTSSIFPSFNAPQASSAPAGGFNFGAPPVSNVFGAANNSSPAPTLFGAPSTTANTFGAPPAPPTFTAPSFGSTSSQPSVGFNFAASGNTSFGGQKQPPSTPIPFSFQPDMKPTFNFTGGSTVTFAASDGSPAQPPQRRIRRAVRRNNR